MTLSQQILTAFITACFTLLGGCGLLLLTELLVKPYIACKNALSEVTFKLIFHANYISARLPDSDNLKEGADPAKVEAYINKCREASNAIREMAARLRAVLVACPFPRFYGWLSKLHLIPSPKVIDDAAGRLIRISNEMMETKKNFANIRDDYSAVCKTLGIPIDQSESK